MKSFVKQAIICSVAATCLVSVSNDTDACSRALWTSEGHPVLVGRTMDWTGKMGTMLHVMPRGIAREGLTDENPLKWTSKYGSVVTTIWDGATADGINEAGLNANLLYLAETKYGERDPARPGLTVALWAQYFLDNFATVAEAVEAADSFQVQPFELIHLGEPADAPVHLSLADPSGDSAVIEILDGKTVIHHGSEYTVMTNSPVFDEQLVLLKQYQGLGGKKPIPGSMDAEDRFARGAFYLTKLPANPESYQEAVAGVLSVMRNMATPLGAVDPVKPNVSPTQWTTISDLTEMRYYFEFSRMPNVVWVDLDKLDLSEGASEQRFNLLKDVEAAGEVSGKFQPVESFKFQKAYTEVDWKPNAD